MKEKWWNERKEMKEKWNERKNEMKEKWWNERKMMTIVNAEAQVSHPEKNKHEK